MLLLLCSRAHTSSGTQGHGREDYDVSSVLIVKIKSCFTQASSLEMFYLGVHGFKDWQQWVPNINLLDMTDPLQYTTPHYTKTRTASQRSMCLTSMLLVVSSNLMKLIFSIARTWGERQRISKNVDFTSRIYSIVVQWWGFIGVFCVYSDLRRRAHNNVMYYYPKAL